MDNKEKDNLASMVLAPWIQKATALRGVRRKVGGNQLRHSMATLAILIDYHFINPVLLKAAICHDLIEDIRSTNIQELETVDKDAPQVIPLILEVTRREGEEKKDFLERIRTNGSREAKIIKVADRISNLTDLHKGIFDKEFIKKYIEETEEYIYPMALEINEYFAFEIKDLMEDRKKLLL